ncbi:MAG: hypothetical protein ABFS24_15160 [Pseudomonadota bacterium]
MKTLMISDLTLSTELDSEAMATVAGGSHWGNWGYDYKYDASIDNSDRNVFDSVQTLEQTQVFNVTALNSVALAEHLNFDINATITGTNDNYQED